MRHLRYTTRAYVYNTTLRIVRVGVLVQGHMEFDTTLFALLSKLLELLLLRSFTYSKKSVEEMQSRFVVATSQ
jgi:hypothetical protein